MTSSPFLNTTPPLPCLDAIQITLDAGAFHFFFYFFFSVFLNSFFFSNLEAHGNAHRGELPDEQTEGERAAEILDVTAAGAAVPAAAELVPDDCVVRLCVRCAALGADGDRRRSPLSKRRSFRNSAAP